MHGEGKVRVVKGGGKESLYVTVGGGKGSGLRVCVRGWAGEAGEIWGGRGREGEQGARREMGQRELLHAHMTRLGGGIT